MRKTSSKKHCHPSTQRASDNACPTMAWSRPKTESTCPKGCKGAKGDMGIQGIQGVQGVQGIQGIPGIPGGNAPGQIVTTFAIDGPAVPNPIPADNVEHPVLTLPIVVTTGTLDIVANVAYTALGGAVDVLFLVRLDPPNTVVASYRESTPSNLNSSGTVRRRLTGIAPGNYIVRLSALPALNAGATITIPGGPAVPDNNYASIYVQEIA